LARDPVGAGAQRLPIGNEAGAGNPAVHDKDRDTG
jgi:hypothetical protein